jgi:hypothetical protein
MGESTRESKGSESAKRQSKWTPLGNSARDTVSTDGSDSMTNVQMSSRDSGSRMSQQAILRTDEYTCKTHTREGSTVVGDDLV